MNLQKHLYTGWGKQIRMTASLCCRTSLNPDKKTCEFAIVVSDKWQGKGIARLLMQKLIDIARNRGLEVMEGQVLANNYRMLELMMSLNFQVGNDRVIAVLADVGADALGLGAVDKVLAQAALDLPKVLVEGLLVTVVVEEIL